MTQNCKQIQRELESYLRGNLSEAARQSVEKHISNCAGCGELLAFHRSLDAQFAKAIEAPGSLRAKVEDRLAKPVRRRSWLTQAFGDPTMKKILFSSTAVAAVLMGAFVLMPSQANGANAKEKFLSMRSALAKAAQSGELSVTATATSTGLGAVTVSLDGNPLPSDVPTTVTSKDEGSYVEYTVLLNLSEGNFKSIKYGKDHNTLCLVPKAKPGNLDVVRLDPKSGKPVNWSTFSQKEGSFKPLSAESFTVQSTVLNQVAPVNKVTEVHHDPAIDSIITLHIRVGKSNGSATLSVKKTS